MLHSLSLSSTHSILKYFHIKLKNMPESQMIAPAKQTWEGSNNHKERKNKNDIPLGFNEY